MTVEGAEMSEDQVQVLEARWRSQVTGNFRSKHRVPFIPIPRGGKMSWLGLPQATDIEHGNFLDYLVNLLSALYGMDPAEINFPNRSGGIAGATPSMIQSSPEATRLTASRDKGLRTLLAYLEDCMNDELMPALDPTGDFEFSFIGFDRQSDADRLTQDDQKSKVYMTINEIREAHGMDEREDCDIIRDPTWLQARMAAQAQEQQGGLTEEGEGATPEEGGQGGGAWKGEESEEDWNLPEDEEEGDLW